MALNVFADSWKLVLTLFSRRSRRMSQEIKLANVLQNYIADHPSFLSESYQVQLKNAVSVFSKYLGHDATLGDLPDHINPFLAKMRDDGKSPKTVKHRRNSLLVLWRTAFEDRLTDEPPRAKRIILPPKVPHCWTQEQMAHLVATMAKDEREMSNGMQRGLWFASLTLALYSSGLRLSDVVKAERTEVSKEGLYKVIQGKTGRLVVRTLDPRGIALAMATGNPRRDHIWDLPYNRTWIHKQFKLFVGKAGLEGTTRWIRRSAATHLCSQQGIEEARKLLDHRSLTTLVNHYLGTLDSMTHPGPHPLQLGKDTPQQD
jgi:hypothetical protein